VVLDTTRSMQLIADGVDACLVDVELACQELLCIDRYGVRARMLGCGGGCTLPTIH